MRNTIPRILYMGIILFVCLCFHLVGCEKRLTGEKSAVVEGFVKDSLSLIPIAGVDVFLDDHPYYPRPKTDLTGYYRVVTSFGGPTLIKITIKAQGYTTQDKNIILKPNQIQRLDFFLIKEEKGLFF